MIKLVTVTDVDRAIAPIDGMRPNAFSEFSNCQDIIDSATQYVLGYLPQPYVYLLRRANGVVLDTDRLQVNNSGKWILPRPLTGEWSSYILFMAGDKDANGEYTYGDQIVTPESIIDKANNQILQPGIYVLDVVFGDDQTASCPFVLKQLIVDECILRYYESLPEYFANQIMLRLYEDKRMQHSEELVSLRTGRLRIDDWDGMTIATKKKNREINSYMARYFA